MMGQPRRDGVRRTRQYPPGSRMTQSATNTNLSFPAQAGNPVTPGLGNDAKFGGYWIAPASRAMPPPDAAMAHRRPDGSETPRQMQSMETSPGIPLLPHPRPH